MTYSIASLRLVLTLAAQAVGESAEPEPNEFLGRCLGVHRNAIEQEPFILATAIAAKCLGAHAPQTPAQPSVLAFHTAFRRCW